MIRWLMSFAEDKDGHTSSKKLALIIGAWSTGFSIVALSGARAWHVASHGGDVSLELFALAGALCTMAGYSYVQGKKVDKNAPGAD